MTADQVENHRDVRQKDEHPTQASCAGDLVDLEGQERGRRDDHEPARPTKPAPERPRLEEREDAVDGEGRGPDREASRSRHDAEPAREVQAPRAREMMAHRPRELAEPCASIAKRRPGEHQRDREDERPSDELVGDDESKAGRARSRGLHGAMV